MIGFLLHTHVLRTQLAEELTFRELLTQVQKATVELYAHRSPPFDRVVSTVQPERNQAYSPLFQVMLNWRDRDQTLSFIGLHGLEIESLLAESRTAKFDLTLMLTDGAESIDLESSTTLTSLKKLVSNGSSGTSRPCSKRQLPIPNSDSRTCPCLRLQSVDNCSQSGTGRRFHILGIGASISSLKNRSNARRRLSRWRSKAIF
jgi:hypothetical protein